MKYTTPEVELRAIESKDVITTSNVEAEKPLDSDGNVKPPAIDW